MYIRRLVSVLLLSLGLLALATPASAARGGKGGMGDGGGGGDSDGTFKVQVFFEYDSEFQLAATENNVVGKINGNRRGLGEAPMTLSLIYLDTDQLSNCDVVFGDGMIGLFAASTYQDPGSSLFTYIEANFFNFNDSDGVRYSLAFGPDNVDQVSGEWLPSMGETATLTGAELTLKAQSGRAKKGPCNGPITQNWKITVDGEPPM